MVEGNAGKWSSSQTQERIVVCEEWSPTRSFADYLNHYFTRPRVVKLNKEYALIGAELHGSVHYRYSLAGAEQKVLQVGMTVRRLILVHVDGANVKVIMLIAVMSGEYFL